MYSFDKLFRGCYQRHWDVETMLVLANCTNAPYIIRTTEFKQFPNTEQEYIITSHRKNQ